MARIKNTALAALIASTAACSAESLATAPTTPRTASLSASNLVVGACVDAHCAFSVTVTNVGPDCAENVSVAVTMPGPRAASAGPIGTILRPNQSATALGSDLPVGATSLQTIAGGHAIACP